MKIRNIFLAAVGFAMIAATPVLAATGISSVRIDISPDENSTMTPGDIASALEPQTYDNLYYVYSYSTSGNHSTPQVAYNYTMDIRPQNTYEFTDTTSVEVKGASEVSITSRSKDSITISVKTYPFCILENPTNIHEDGEYLRWDKVKYAGKYSILVYYDNDGESKERTLTSTSQKVSLSGYNTGNNELTGYSVRAQRGSEAGANYIAASDYVYPDGSIDDNYEDDKYTFNIQTARSNAIATSTSSGSVNGIKGNSGGPGESIGQSASYQANWQQSGNDWYFVDNGIKRIGWINPINDEWYLMGYDGKMLTGWQLVDGYWYFFNTAHDGAYGKMLVGWWRINRKWYYFNTYKKNNLPYGSMFVNNVTPDGYKVGGDGAWLG